MPATPARIAFITQQFRSVVAGPDSGVITKYGSMARDTAEAPIQSFFDDTADAQVMVTERLNLLKADRRRFKVTIPNAMTGLGLNYSQSTPSATFIDDERQANMSVAVVDVSIDLGSDKTTLGVWG
jgi:hypothetical protein